MPLFRPFDLLLEHLVREHPIAPATLDNEGPQTFAESVADFEFDPLFRWHWFGRAGLEIGERRQLRDQREHQKNARLARQFLVSFSPNQVCAG